MDPNKKLTPNPLMAKKKAKELEILGAPIDSEPTSISPEAAPSEVTPNVAANPTERPISHPVSNPPERPASRPAPKQFNLRPSTNPVSDFRRRQSYKGVANPANAKRRRPINNANLEPRVDTIDNQAVPAPARVQPAPTQRPVRTAPRLDAAEIQNLGVQVDQDTTLSNVAAVDAENSRPKKSHKKLLAFFVSLLLIAVVAAIVVFVLMKIFPRQNYESGQKIADIDNSSVSDITPGGTTQDESTPEDSTETTTAPHDIATPPKLIDGTVEVSIVGFADGANPDLDHKIVKVSLTNRSDVVQSIKISLAAVDEAGKILGVSNLYYEGLEPGGSYELEAFTSTSLTDEQLASAYYKIRSASVYQTKVAPSEETQ